MLVRIYSAKFYLGRHLLQLLHELIDGRASHSHQPHEEKPTEQDEQDGGHQKSGCRLSPATAVNGLDRDNF